MLVDVVRGGLHRVQRIRSHDLACQVDLADAAPRRAACAARRRPARSSSARCDPLQRTPTCARARAVLARRRYPPRAPRTHRTRGTAARPPPSPLPPARRPVELDDQHRTRAGRIPARDRSLGGLDRQRIHHLDRRRQDPGCDHAARPPRRPRPSSRTPASSVRTASATRRTRTVIRTAIPSVPSEPTNAAEQVGPVVVA